VRALSPYNLAGEDGIEPSAARLTAGCSTIELLAKKLTHRGCAVSGLRSVVTLPLVVAVLKVRARFNGTRGRLFPAWEPATV
jgi:hypothetical protein